MAITINHQTNDISATSGDMTIDGSSLVTQGDTSTASMSFVIDEDNMVSNSATKVPTQQSVKAYTDASVSGLVDSAPSTLDTLNELAAALGDDANFSTTVTNSIATKMPLSGGTFTGDVTIDNNDELRFGTGTGQGYDFRMWWDDTNSKALIQSPTNESWPLEVRMNGGLKVSSYNGGQVSLHAIIGGAVTLYHNSSSKLETTSTGLNINGNIARPSGDFSITTAGAFTLESTQDDADVKILSDDGSGGTTEYFRADGSNGSAKLFYYGSEKITTNNTGVQVTGTIMGDRLDIDNVEINGGTITGQTGGLSLSGNVTIENGTLTAQDDVTFTGASYNAVWDKSDNALEFADNAKATFGAGSDLQIWHDASNSYILENGTGVLKIQAANLEILHADGSRGIRVTDDGGPVLYYDGSSKITVNSGGATVSGTLAATAVTGDGSGLTNLPAGASSNVGTGNFIGGTNAGANLASGGNYNTLLGQEAGNDVTTGDDNVAVGYQALPVMTTGSDNIAIGRRSIYSCTAADANTGVGHYSLYNVNTGYQNTSIGYKAGRGITSGYRNVAIGVNSMQGTLNSVTGYDNLAIGEQTLEVLTSGHNNIAIARNAGRNISTGLYNIVLGVATGEGITTGGNNVGIGREAVGSLSAAATGSHNCGLAYRALANVTSGAYNIGLGSNSGKSITTGSFNIAIGRNTLDLATGGSDHIAIGKDAMSNGAVSSVNQNIGIGSQVLYDLTSGYYNVAIGRIAGENITTAIGNTFIGDSAGSEITTGGKNTILGRFNGNQDSLDIRTLSNRIVLADGDSNVGLYIDSSQDAHFDGNVIAYSTTISDERLKKDIKPITGALDKVGQLSGYTFTYKNDGKQSAGVIAQEVEAVLPSAVTESTLPLKTDGDVEYKTVQYDQLHGLLIEAIKELKAEIEELKNGSAK